MKHQRAPQEWSGSLKRLSSSDTADNPTTREETAKNIEHKERPQQRMQTFAGDIFSNISISPFGKILEKEDRKEEPSRTERSPQVVSKRPSCRKITL